MFARWTTREGLADSDLRGAAREIENGLVEAHLGEVLDSARDLHEALAIGAETLRAFDALCLPQVPSHSAADIERVRKANKASQGVFAAYLNVSKVAVTAWEQYVKTPSRIELKLLNLVDRKGLKTLV